MIKSSFMSGVTADKVVSFSVKIEIYTAAVRSIIGGSRWVWTSTVVIVHHN